MSNEQGTGEKLKSLLGDEHTKAARVTKDVFKEALAEVNAERYQQAKARAKEVIAKAIELQKQRNQLDATHKKAMKKFDEDLSKLLKEIENFTKDAPVTESTEDNEEKPQAG